MEPPASSCAHKRCDGVSTIQSGCTMPCTCRSRTCQCGDSNPFLLRGTTVAHLVAEPWNCTTAAVVRAVFHGLFILANDVLTPSATPSLTVYLASANGVFTPSVLCLKASMPDLFSLYYHGRKNVSRYLLVSFGAFRYPLLCGYVRFHAF